MTFTILADADVKQILHNLTPQDLDQLVEALNQALVQFSCGDEQQYQPHRAVVTRPGGQVSLFMPATTERSIGVKIVSISPSQEASTIPALQSALTICDALGQAVGVLNAAELTAFRTALGSMLLYRLRAATGRVVVFGAGKQALWHIRLAVLLRGDDIRQITIVNRSKQRARELINNLSDSSWPSHIRLDSFDSKEATENLLEDLVSTADVIFCTTPSTEPLFPAAFLTSDRARERPRFISAIGSYRLDMAEIDPELLRTVVDADGVFSRSVWQGSIIVDTREGCLQEAGELVKAGISPSQMLEVGRIQGIKAANDSTGLQNWLESGFVIYKSVGLGVMDIAIGDCLLRLAESKGVGIRLPTF